MKHTVQNDSSPKHPSQPIKWVVIILLCIAMVAGGLILTPLVLRLEDPAVAEKFHSFVDRLGFWGIMLMLLVQFLQVILAIIPGEPIEILAGVMYGGWGGLLICQIGIILGQSSVFLLVRRFGKGFIERFFGKSGQKEMRLLKNPKTLDLTLFTLFFIPGTPKDLLCYLAPLTNISLLRFLCISCVARIPSVVSSTFAGAALGEGDFGRSILLFLLVAALGIGGILLREPVMRALHRHQQSRGNK